MTTENTITLFEDKNRNVHIYRNIIKIFLSNGLILEIDENNNFKLYIINDLQEG
jgi:hypothetical protein